MNKQIYYQLAFSLESPLLIGCGRAEHTDNDVLLDGCGAPYLPGTTIAGMLRAMARDTFENGGKTEAELFGSIPKPNDPERKDQNGRLVHHASDIYVFDGILAKEFAEKENKNIIGKRDNVALNGYKTAADGMKFDYEVVEPPQKFLSIIEIPKHVSDETVESFEKLLHRIVREGCSLGHKKSRGMGRFTVNIKKATFDFAKVEEKEAWLNFQPFEEESWKEAVWEDDNPAIQPDISMRSNHHMIRLNLHQKGGIAIRVPSSDDRLNYYPMQRIIENQRAAIVPGTSWAGAFRHRVRALLSNQSPEERQRMIQLMFGYVADQKSAHQKEDEAELSESQLTLWEEKEPKARRSAVTFSETVLQGVTWKTSTRNAIDRFSGKAKNGALFTGELGYDGSGELMIQYQEEPGMKKAIWALGVAVADLGNGFLAVGGLTSVGCGILEIKSIEFDGEVIKVDAGWENELIRRMMGKEEG